MGIKTPAQEPQAAGTRPKETDFVKTKDGSTDFGQIDKDVAKDIGGTEAPIRLQVGNEKYGEHHLNTVDDGKRLEAIKAAGYENAKDFIEYVSKNWNEIRKGTGTSKLLIKKNGKDSVVAIELKSNDKGKHYTVITGGILRERYAANKKLLCKRGAPSLDRPEPSTPLLYDTSNKAQESITERTGTSSSTYRVPNPDEIVKGGEL